jgi:arylsulfatase A-like enzyme
MNLKLALPACLAVALCISSARGQAPPNLLLLITDDQRWDMMGNVTPALHTPEMDRLAREGVRFERAFVTTPICAASRASLLCGVVERTHRYTFKTPPLGGRWVQASFPRLLRNAGYRTGYVGKFGVNTTAGATKLLYDEFVATAPPYWKDRPDGTRRHLTDIEADHAVRFLEQSARAAERRPFCLTVGFNAPHADDPNPLQYAWQKEVDHLYGDVRVPRPPLSEPEFYNSLPEFLRDGTMNRHRWRWRFDFESKRQQMTKGYWRMISGVDLAIGRIRSKLQELGLAENTVIVLMGDNGYFLGERGYAGKWLPYDQSIHVPLLIFDPRGKATKPGGRPQVMALNIDIAPTLLELAGVAVPPVMQGRSLVAVALGQTPADWRSDFWIEHLMMEPSIRKHEGVRNQRYRYSRYFEAQPVLEELYDLQTDPLETINLASSAEHRRTLRELRTRTDELRTQYGGEFSARLWKEKQP